VVGQSNHVNGKVQNNVALNPGVDAPGLNYVGRVVGRLTERNVGSISGQTNNYAKAMTGTMKFDTYAVQGTDITAAEYNSASWWTTPGNWTGGAWDTAIWNIANNSLPALKMTSMPGGTPAQNPQM
jgi:hypothetical protein